MHQHGASTLPVEEGQRQVILVGNPNVGKSLVFSYLTGKYVTVSNYPGTTVEITQGTGRFDRGSLIIDTPGVYSLIPRSEDERVAREILLIEGEKVVVQIADAKNLRRTLLLSSQLAEMGLPFILNLNMWDEAQRRGIKLDAERLSQILGVPVIPTVAVRKRGLSKLKETMSHPAQSSLRIQYESDIEKAVGDIEELLPSLPISRRSTALMLLSGDETLKERLSTHLNQEKLKKLDEIIVELQSRHAEPLGYLLNLQRADAVEGILQQVVAPRRLVGSSIADFLGRWSMHPFLGIPFLLLILFLIYEVVGVFGAGIVVDFVEGVVFGQYLNVGAAWLFGLIPVPLIQELFIGEYGLITMGLTYAIAIVLPIMTFFFVAFGLLEDSGYLPRLAIFANKILKAIGLSGRATLPLVLGLGCDTMATMTTRVLDSKRERVIATLLLALAIPCSAQLGVILGMMGGVSGRAFALFVVIILSQLLLVGFLASKVIPGKTSDFIVEIPPIRVPRLSNVALKTVYRVEWFLKEAVPLFLLGTLILFVADKVGLLGQLERLGSPIVVGFLGLPVAATRAFILGFLRRDYGAAGLFVLAEKGLMDPTQIVVSMVVITLFVPCIANFFMIIKERGLRTALAIVAFILPFAVLVGGVLNLILRALRVAL